MASFSVIIFGVVVWKIAVSVAKQLRFRLKTITLGKSNEQQVFKQPKNWKLWIDKEPRKLLWMRRSSEIRTCFHRKRGLIIGNSYHNIAHLSQILCLYSYRVLHYYGCVKACSETMKQILILFQSLTDNCNSKYNSSQFRFSSPGHVLQPAGSSLIIFATNQNIFWFATWL